MLREGAMMQTTDRKDWYISGFADFEKSLNGESSTPVHQIRKEAIDRFGALGLPTTRDEEWRYTSVAPLARVDFVPVIDPDFSRVSAADLAPFAFAELAGPRLVFVNGHYAPELSTPGKLPPGTRVTSLAAALAKTPELVQAHLGRHASFAQEAFTALNTAFMRNGAFIYLPRGAVVEAPIHLLFAATASDQPVVSYPRTLIVAEEGTQASLIESYAGLGEPLYLTNAVTEVVVGKNAVLDHYRIQRDSREAFHVSATHVHESGNCNFRSTSVTLGGRLTRNHVHTALRGEGIDSTLNGLYVVDGQQHVDNHTLVEHARPHCSSHESYKGILGDHSTGVFRGQILVHQAAPQTDAYQANQNLLLSEDADINTKPQLEIYADDVKCSHGATVGQLDADAVFYLRSRGIGAGQAAQLLIHAFAGEILDRVRIDPVREQLEQLVTRRLARAGRSARTAP